jgi:hypothetical protein
VPARTDRGEPDRRPACGTARSGRAKRGIARQAEALTNLAERLAAPQVADVAAEAYAAAGRIRDSTTRIRLFARLVPAARTRGSGRLTSIRSI